MVAEWIKHGKASVLGIVTGAVGGMVAITPASGSVGPLGAIVIGAARRGAVLLGRHQSQATSRPTTTPSTSSAFTASAAWPVPFSPVSSPPSPSEGRASPAPPPAWPTPWAARSGRKIVGVLFTTIYCAVLSFVILKAVDAVVGLRVEEEEEDRGLDISLHNEQGYYSEV